MRAIRHRMIPYSTMCLSQKKKSRYRSTWTTLFSYVAVNIAMLRCLFSANNYASNAQRKVKASPQHSFLLNGSGKFSFVHVSKCGGASWIRLLKDHSFNLYPQKEMGPEHSVWYQNNVACKDANHHLISLRSPRHHVWSLFSECKYDTWGKAATSNTQFPRSGNSPESDEVDFDMWLNHFSVAGNSTDFYGCYHPANYQSRALTSQSWNPHGLDADGHFEPNETLARNTLLSFDFIALVEFFHESRCLFYYRLGLDAPVSAAEYLEKQCQCDTISSGLSDVHVKHHDLGRRSVLNTLQPVTLEKIMDLTRMDTKIYIMALRGFMADIAWLESTSALGRRVLCDSSLDRLQSELAYLERDKFSVTGVYLYHSAWAQTPDRCKNSNQSTASLSVKNCKDLSHDKPAQNHPKVVQGASMITSM